MLMAMTMKISQINLAAAGTLLLVVTALVAAMFWSLATLNSSFSTSRDYQKLQIQINTEISRPILTYLSSGDATLLTQIDSTLSRLINDDDRVVMLKNNQHFDLSQTLKELQSTALFDLREAGKLKRPQELLINNERELLGVISQLKDYSAQAEPYKAALQSQYSDLLDPLTSLIPELAHSRESYFSISPRNSTDIEFKLTQLAELSAKLAQLPRLGLFSEEQDDGLQSLLGNSESESNLVIQEELGDLSSQELNSLIKRYRKELNNIEGIYDHRTKSIDETTYLIDMLNRQLEENRSQLEAQYDSTKQQVYILLIICVLLIVLAGMVMGILNTRLSRIISETCSDLNLLAGGNLLHKQHSQSKIEEIQILRQSFISLSHYFNELIEKIDTESSMLDQLGQNLNSGSDRLQSTVSQQQHSTEQASVQIQQLSYSYLEVAKNAVQTSDATCNASELAVSGVDEMNSTQQSILQLAEETRAASETLQQLKEDGREIGTALHVIQNFAEQTNLLALNAAIEAARAGESGRGFAVVADEVIALAGNTARAADDIERIIKKLNLAIDTISEKIEQQQHQVESTVLLAENAKTSVDKIRISIDEIDNMSSMIASATEEQSLVTNQISEIIHKTLEQSQQSAREASSNKEFANQIGLTSSSLMLLLQQFRNH